MHLLSIWVKIIYLINQLKILILIFLELYNLNHLFEKFVNLIYTSVISSEIRFSINILLFVIGLL